MKNHFQEEPDVTLLCKEDFLMHNHLFLFSLHIPLFTNVCPTLIVSSGDLIIYSLNTKYRSCTVQCSAPCSSGPSPNILKPLSVTMSLSCSCFLIKITRFLEIRERLSQISSSVMLSLYDSHGSPKTCKSL